MSFLATGSDARFITFCPDAQFHSKTVNLAKRKGKSTSHITVSIIAQTKNKLKYRNLPLPFKAITGNSLFLANILSELKMDL